MDCNRPTLLTNANDYLSKVVKKVLGVTPAHVGELESKQEQEQYAEIQAWAKEGEAAAKASQHARKVLESLDHKDAGNADLIRQFERFSSCIEEARVAASPLKLAGCRAARRGDLGEVKRLLGGRGQCDSIAASFVFDEAVESGQVPIAQWLHSEGFAPRDSPLNSAVRNNHFAMVKWFVETIPEHGSFDVIGEVMWSDTNDKDKENMVWYLFCARHQFPDLDLTSALTASMHSKWTMNLMCNSLKDITPAEVRPAWMAADRANAVGAINLKYLFVNSVTNEKQRPRLKSML